MKMKDAMKEQSRRLQEERNRAQREADKLKAENKRKSDADYRRRLGRSSLISGSELGVSDKLG